MRLLRWWREVERGYSQDFDERASLRVLEAVRDAFVALVVVLLLTVTAQLVLLPEQPMTIPLAMLPAVVLGVAGLAFFASAAVRGAFTWRIVATLAVVLLVATALSTVAMVVLGAEGPSAAGVAIGSFCGLGVALVLMGIGARRAGYWPRSPSLPVVDGKGAGVRRCDAVSTF